MVSYRVIAKPPVQQINRGQATPSDCKRYLYPVTMPQTYLSVPGGPCLQRQFDFCLVLSRPLHRQLSIDNPRSFQPLRLMRRLCCVFLLPLLVFAASSSAGDIQLLQRRPEQRTTGGLHVPLLRRRSSKLLRRDGETTAIGLGDFEDV